MFEKILNNKKRCWIVIFNFISVFVIFYSMTFFNRYSIFVQYNDDMPADDCIVYYNCDNSGFTEEKSVNNKLYTANKLVGLSVAPKGAKNKKIGISGLDIYKENVLIGSYSGDELMDKYIQNKDSFYEENGCIIIQSDGERKIEFNTRMLKELNDFNANVFVGDITRLVVLYALIFVFSFVYLLGKKYAKKHPTKDIKHIGTIFASVVFAFAVVCWFVGSVKFLCITAPVCMLEAMFLMGRYNIVKGKNVIYPALAFIISAVFLLNMQTTASYESDFFVYTFWIVCLSVLMQLCFVLVYESLWNTNREKTNSHINAVAGYFVKILIVLLVYEFLKIYLLYGYPSVNYCLLRTLTNIMQLNVFWTLLVVCAIYGLFGVGVTNAVGGIVSFVLIAGNYIKMSYHNTVLTPDDFKNMKAMISIAPDVIGKTTFYAILAVIAVFVLIIVFNIKKIFKHIKLKPFIPLCIAALVVATGFTKQISDKKYESIGLFNKPYSSDITSENTNGVFINNYYKLLVALQNKMQKPNDYNEENMTELKAEFDKLKRKTDDVKPNVICILAESYFDLNRVDSLDISEDIIPNTRSMGMSNILSPRYGGYTAAVEYEVLTGNTLAFYPSGVVPYTSYYTDKERKMPSVPLEFADNGYKTFAIHPNFASFYNRDTAYKMMGIEKFYSSDDFDDSDLLENKMVKDKAVADKIISTIEDNDEPVFTLGITIAAHFTSDKRFKDTTISVDGDGLDSDDIAVLEQQAQAYRETDDMIGYLKDYVDNCDEPTLLYVFGDHLPPVSALADMGYIDDKENKYTTIGVAYSNYKDISLKDGATPNYIGAQMIVDSGIEHSSYFDYIYKLRDEIPRLHKEFTDIDTENNEALKKYYMLQYDLVFGERYLYRNREK